LEKVQNGFKVIISGVIVVELALSGVTANGVADASGRFDVHHVGIVVP
jgi:hypothetical protein